MSGGHSSSSLQVETIVVYSLHWNEQHQIVRHKCCSTYCEHGYTLLRPDKCEKIFDLFVDPAKCTGE